MRFFWLMNLGYRIIKTPLERFVMVRKGSFLCLLVMTRLLRFGLLSLGAVFIMCKFSFSSSVLPLFSGRFIAGMFIDCDLYIVQILLLFVIIMRTVASGLSGNFVTEAACFLDWFFLV